MEVGGASLFGHAMQACVVSSSDRAVLPIWSVLHLKIKLHTHYFAYMWYLMGWKTPQLQEFLYRPMWLKGTEIMSSLSDLPRKSVSKCYSWQVVTVEMRVWMLTIPNEIWMAKNTHVNPCSPDRHKWMLTIFLQLCIWCHLSPFHQIRPSFPTIFST